METHNPAPIHPKKSSRKTRLFIKIQYAIAIGILLYIGLNITLFLLGKSKSIVSRDPFGQFQQMITHESAAPSPTPLLAATPRPIRPLPSGKQTYNYSHGENVVGPKIKSVIVDPLTPGVGETQTITITVTNGSPVTNAQITLHTDTKITTNPLKLTGGTTTDGTWVGSWAMPETYNYMYYIQFSLESATGNYKDGMLLRKDP